MTWTIKTAGASLVGDNTFSGNNTFTGTNTYTGPEKRTVRIITVSGAVTVTANDYLVIVNKAFAETTKVDLSSGVAVTGQQFIIKDGSGTAGTTNAITVSAQQLIDSSATAVIGNNWGSATIIFNGTKFNVV